MIPLSFLNYWIVKVKSMFSHVSVFEVNRQLQLFIPNSDFLTPKKQNKNTEHAQLCRRRIHIPLWPTLLTRKNAPWNLSQLQPIINCVIPYMVSCSPNEGGSQEKRIIIYLIYLLVSPVPNITWLIIHSCWMNGHNKCMMLFLLIVLTKLYAYYFWY